MLLALRYGLSKKATASLFLRDRLRSRSQVTDLPPGLDLVEQFEMVHCTVQVLRVIGPMNSVQEDVVLTVFPLSDCHLLHQLTVNLRDSEKR